MKQIKIIGLCKKFLICVIVFLLVFVYFFSSVCSVSAAVNCINHLWFSLCDDGLVDHTNYATVSLQFLSGYRVFVTTRIDAGSYSSNCNVRIWWKDLNGDTRNALLATLDLGGSGVFNCSSAASQLRSFGINIMYPVIVDCYNYKTWYDISSFDFRLISTGFGPGYAYSWWSPENSSITDFDVSISNIVFNPVTNALTCTVTSLVTGVSISSVTLDVVDVYTSDCALNRCLSQIVQSSSGTTNFTINFKSGSLSPGSHLVGITVKGSNGVSVKKGFSFNTISGQVLPVYKVEWSLYPDALNPRRGSLTAFYSLDDGDNWTPALAKYFIVDNVFVKTINGGDDTGLVFYRSMDYWNVEADVVDESDVYEANVRVSYDGSSYTYVNIDFSFNSSSYAVYDVNGNKTDSGISEGANWLQRIFNLLTGFVTLIDSFVRFLLAVTELAGTLVGLLLSYLFTFAGVVVSLVVTFFQYFYARPANFIGLSSLGFSMSEVSFLPSVSVSAIDNILILVKTKFIDAYGLLWGTIAVLMFISKYVRKEPVDDIQTLF